MKKTTIYLPDDLKRDVERVARDQNRSEADVIRDAIAASVRRPHRKPRIPLTGKGLGAPVSEAVDEYMDGFGE